MALLAGPGAVHGDLGSVALVLLTAVGYATGPPIASRKLAHLPGLAMTAVCLGFAAVLYAPAAALTWPRSAPSAEVLASLAGLALICTALAFVLFFRLIAEVGPARATVITYVNPAVAVGLGVGVLGEPLTPEIIAAFGLILAGSVLATRSGQRRRPAGGAGRRGSAAHGTRAAEQGPVTSAAQPGAQLSALDALLDGPGAGLLASLRHQALTPGTALALGTRLRERYPAGLVAAALAQHELRLAARAKFSRAMDMFFTRAGLEQASAEVVAQHRQARFSTGRPAGRPVLRHRR